MQIIANPMSKGITFENRFEDNYNGKATITKVDVVRSTRNPSQNGSLAVHMTGSVNGKTVDIVDFYGMKRPQTPIQTFAQQMLNRATAAQKSAGVPHFSQPIEAEQARQVVFGIFQALVGKEVTISQWTPAGQAHPNINYKFDEVPTLTQTTDTQLPGTLAQDPVAITADQLANIPF